jgi:hypothetical protein
MRRTVLGPLALSIALLAAPAFAADGVPVPAELRAEVARAESVGEMIYRHDQAAWHTSDALLAAGAFEHLPGEGRGWLTRDEGGKVVVRYFAEVDFETVAFAQADFDPATGKASNARRLLPAQAPTAAERALLKARGTAIEAARGALRCSSKINTVVLPGQGAAGDEVHVFVMSAWEGGPFVFGGHQRVRVSGDGAKVLEVYEHTKSCMDIEPDSAPEGYEPMRMSMVTHLTSPTPDEFHVFLARQHDYTLMVATTQNERLWEVEGGHVRAVATDDAK